MFETYIVNGQKCTWTFFLSEWEKHPDLPLRDKKGRRITKKEYIKLAKPQFRLRKETLTLTTSEYANKSNCRRNPIHIPGIRW
jgi:hypothetical protein